MDSIKYQKITNLNLTTSVINFIMDKGWIFHQENNPKQISKSTHRKLVGWTKEKKHQHGAVNLKDLERFCMKEWSLISYQVFSKLFRHYRRKLRAVTLGKGRCNNCGQNELEKTSISQWTPPPHTHTHTHTHFQLFYFNDTLELCKKFWMKY